MTGACAPRELLSSSGCLPKRDINATWDPITMNILVRSPVTGDNLRGAVGSDRLFVEFGRVRKERIRMEKGGGEGLLFDGGDRHKMVVATEKLIRAGIFSLEPFIFHVNESIDVASANYGMRLCTYNSSIVQDPYQHNWDADSVGNKSGDIVQVVQLSAVHFTNDLRGDFIGDNYWTAFFNIGKITLMVVLVLIMGVLIYVNCARIKALYDRKRTHYFRPYYIDPQVNVSSTSRYPGLTRTDTSGRIDESCSDINGNPCRDYQFSGYSDSDIYGYEAPALYPVQCKTPEEELPQPKIEIVRAGGRLAVNLPSSVLEGRCRLWVEVKMLPRCVRLEPFSIQKNIEIDCERNVDLEICSRDANPVCADVIDIWGRGGKARIAWEAPANRKPLYYHVRYGPAQMKGVAPFVTWQLATKRDARVDGDVTSLSLDIPEDQDYGVQVCAILTKHRTRPKFGVVRFTPFQCTSCRNTPSHEVGRCGECGKIEGITVAERSWATASRPIAGVATKSTEQKESKEERQESPPQTVFRMETDLVVAAGTRQAATNISLASNEMKPVNKKTLSEPVPLERCEEINLISSTTEETTTSEEVTTTIITTTTVMSTTTESPTTTTSTEQSTTTVAETTTTEGKSMIKVVEVGTDLQYPKDQRRIPESSIGKTRKEEKKKTKLPKKEIIKENRVELSKELEESVMSLEKALEVVESPREHVNINDMVRDSGSKEESTRQTDNTEIEAELYDEDEKEKEKEEKEVPPLVAQAAVIHVQSKDVQNASSLAHGTRLHLPDGLSDEKPLKCLLASGIVCEHGCETRKRCICPSFSSASMTGACALRELLSSSGCLPKRDINATWDPITMNILVRSPVTGDHLRGAVGSDRLFVEFGRVRKERIRMEKGGGEGLLFDGGDRHKMVVATEKLIRAGIFSLEPFIFHVNESIDVASANYGMRLCTYNSSIVQDPYQHNWDADSVGNKSGDIVQVVQLSAVHFTNDLRGDFIGDNYWTAFFNIGKITLMVILILIMGVLIYVNCARIKALYDRKRTHYFRPYYIEPQVNVSSTSRYPGLTRTDTSGYYDTRSRII